MNTRTARWLARAGGRTPAGRRLLLVVTIGRSSPPPSPSPRRPRRLSPRSPARSTRYAPSAQYLTSPWTYDALASGSHSYTVAQYESLPGYGTTLPPLPAYIAAESPGTKAAMIYAPGSTVNRRPTRARRRPCSTSTRAARTGRSARVGQRRRVHRRRRPWLPRADLRRWRRRPRASARKTTPTITPAARHAGRPAPSGADNDHDQDRHPRRIGYVTFPTAPPTRSRASRARPLRLAG